MTHYKLMPASTSSYKKACDKCLKTYLFLQFPQIRCPQANWYTCNMIILQNLQKNQFDIFFWDVSGMIRRSMAFTMSIFPTKRLSERLGWMLQPAIQLKFETNSNKRYPQIWVRLKSCRGKFPGTFRITKRGDRKEVLYMYWGEWSSSALTHEKGVRCD